MKFENPSETIFYQIEKTIKQYRTMAQGNLNQLGYKVTINQILLLVQIDNKPDVSQVALAELLFKDVASITRMIELLVKEGFVLRTENNDDRRKKDLKITSKGKKLLESAIPIIVKNREIAQEDLTNVDKQTLSKLLNKIIINISK